MPTASVLFIDKISLTFALHDQSTRTRISEWFRDEPAIVCGCRVTPTRGSRYYSLSKEIVFDVASKCKLLAEFSQGRSRSPRQAREEYEEDPEAEPDNDIGAIGDPRRPLRLEWNPARLRENPEHQAAFVRIMRLWFEDALAEEMAAANVTRIDLATDIRGLNINRITTARSDTTVMSARYRRDGAIQTHYLGSKNTNLRIVIYDKRAQQRGRVRGGPFELTRIEARIKTASNFDALRRYPNPFSKLTIRELRHLEVGSPQNNVHEWDWFIDSCRQRGAEAALNLIHNSRTRSRWNNKFTESQAPSWWQPEELWGGLENSIRRLGLFPPRSRIR